MGLVRGHGRRGRTRESTDGVCQTAVGGALQAKVTAQHIRQDPVGELVEELSLLVRYIPQFGLVPFLLSVVLLAFTLVRFTVRGLEGLGGDLGFQLGAKLGGDLWQDLFSAVVFQKALNADRLKDAVVVLASLHEHNAAAVCVYVEPQRAAVERSEKDRGRTVREAGASNGARCGKRALGPEQVEQEPEPGTVMEQIANDGYSVRREIRGPILGGASKEQTESTVVAALAKDADVGRENATYRSPEEYVELRIHS
ncbi:hypothetical protein N7523_008391 [Penicillium sp. IBT 18751x]|nr:hypothetical protein N7523_008391 [Penicillium sp. IBT 18751x]